MSADLINLRLARKRKARAEADAAAAEARARHGRTRAEKLSDSADRTRAAADLDRKRLDEKPRQ